MGLQKILLKRRPEYVKSGRVTPVEKIADLLGVNRVFLRRPPLEIETPPDRILSPAQAKVETVAPIGSDLSIEEKAVFGRKRRFGLPDILKDPAQAERFAGGSYAKLYLAPWDLHFLLFPCTGRVVDYEYKAGWAFPLLLMRSGDVLNERLCITVETAWGFPMAVVMIGSWMVNGIHHAFQPGASVNAGDDLGYFKVGSSVAIAFPEGAVEWLCCPGKKLSLGQPLARVLKSKGC